MLVKAAFRMQDARDGLELRDLALVREADTAPGYRTGTEGYEYAVPPQQLNLQVAGNTVMEGAQQGRQELENEEIRRI